jgi:hypothetical protein
MASPITVGVIIVVALMGCVLLYQYYSAAPADPLANTPLVGAPPAGSNLYVGVPVHQAAGQKWPDPSSVCGGVYPLGEITRDCPVGNNPELINGGTLKCVNSARTDGTGCRQATTPLN